MSARILGVAQGLGLLPTGGSDWHGEQAGVGSHGMLGSELVPAAWLEALEARRDARKATQ